MDPGFYARATAAYSNATSVDSTLMLHRLRPELHDLEGSWVLENTGSFEIMGNRGLADDEG